MKITLNGQPYTTSATDIATLLTELGLSAKQVAIEQNRQIVPRSQHGITPIKQGDVIEVVTFIGGG